MVDFAFIAKVPTIAGFAAASMVFGVNPALANSSAAADVAAPLRAAQDARAVSQASGDDEFRQLFANWRSLDKSASFAAPVANSSFTAAPAVVTTARVAIPSRIPVEGVRLSSEFGMRYHPVLGGRRAHKGVDLASPMGTPVHATADGVISKAEWFSSYGLYAALEHGGEIQTRYGHMSRLNVYAGQHVRKGDVIGYVGSTGRSTGPHLHYEVRIAGVAVNPIPYMQADQFNVQQAADPLPAPTFGQAARRRR